MTKSSTATHTAEATPNLRERAERLRDAAGRFIRRTPVEPTRDAEDAAASLELVSMVAEWTRLAEAQDSGDLSDDEADAISPEWSRLHGDICRFPARSLADLTAKAPLYRYERDDEHASCKGASTMPLRAWESVVRDIEALGVRPSQMPGADPILAAIAETRRLHTARERSFDLPLPPGDLGLSQEQNDATDAFFDHVNDVLLTTVPTTMAGCTALARYAGEFLETAKFCLDENLSNDQHVRILDLIARSPLLDGPRQVDPPPPDFSDISVCGLMRTYNAFKLATDVMGLTGWTLSVEGKEQSLLNEELDRLLQFQNYIADELARREEPDRTDASHRIDVLLNRAVACGRYDEAAELAVKADARGL